MSNGKLVNRFMFVCLILLCASFALAVRNIDWVAFVYLGAGILFALAALIFDFRSYQPLE